MTRKASIPLVFVASAMGACAVGDADRGAIQGGTDSGATSSALDDGDASASGDASGAPPNPSTSGPSPGSDGATTLPSDDDGTGDATTGEPAGGELPPKIVAGYWQMWQGPRVADVTANAPEYNLQYAAFALGSEPGTGNVYFDPQFSPSEEFKADMAESKAAGSLWLISIGGGGEQNIVLVDEGQAGQMVDTLIPIIDEYGFDGIDFDLESGPDGWSSSAMKSVAEQLVDHYGDEFIISAAPRPYEDYYRDWAVEMGDTLDLFGYQFYDASEFNDPQFLRDNINYRVGQTLDMGIPASKIMIGCITYSDYPYGHNTVEVYRDIFLDLEAEHPDLRGVFIWETSLDAKENWSFAHVMGEALLQ